MYQIQAKSTTYAGVRFRSQLEATWAAFFDVAGMPWEYEPVTLPGWVPDFRLFGRFLCEVKPIEMDGFSSAVEPLVRKAAREEPTLVFGRRPAGALACMVIGKGGGIGGRTVFFDPRAPFRMQSVDGTGNGHPLRGSAELTWRTAGQRLRFQNRRCMRSSA